SPCCLFSYIRCPPPSSPFPYTTLFRSRSRLGAPQFLSGSSALTAALKGVRHVWRAILVVIPRSLSVSNDHFVRPNSCASSRTDRSEEHTSELQSPYDLVCRLLLEKKNE